MKFGFVDYSKMDTMTTTDSDKRQHVQNMAHVAISYELHTFTK